MRRARAAVIGGLALALACGPGEGPAPAPTPGPPGAEAPEAAPAPAPVAERSAAPTLRRDAAPSVFDDCPEGTNPRELAIPAVDTVMRWCEREGQGGARIQHGLWEKLREGRVLERGLYVEGVRDGPWIVFWPNGQPQSEGRYQDGQRIGVWSFWRDDGSLIRRIDYASPDSRAIEVSETPSPAPAPGGARPSLRLRFENGRATDLLFAVEPSTEAYAMPPGASYELRTTASADEIVVESTDDGLVVRPGSDARSILVVDGVEIDLTP